MNPSTNLGTIELLDEIDHLLFLCDRLSNRLLQVNSYVDEVKQIWINKLHGIQLNSNISVVIAHRVSKCNQVVLNAAEKLAIVELQTDSLYNLQSLMPNIVPINIEKQEVGSLTSHVSHSSLHGSSSIQIAPVKNETINTEILSQRSVPSYVGRLYYDQQHDFHIQSSLHTDTNSSTNTFTPRNSASLSQEKFSAKQSLEQIPAAFQKTLINQKKNDTIKQESLLQNLSTTQTSDFQGLQKSMRNGSNSDYQHIITNPVASRLSDAHLSRILNESSQNNGKIRVKMQIIKANTIWHHAAIPIIDHPSAFFVCNQDPRVAEQFNMLSKEMNNHYSRSVNVVSPLRNPTIGDFCVARFSEDNLWYRARVVLVQEESVLVVFIDYGNSECKLPNEIFPMYESFALLPAMSVACTLAESFPQNENSWMPEAIQIFDLLVKNRAVEVQFQQRIAQQWPLHFVKIFVDGQSITQHPKLAPFITAMQNEQIAMQFNEKLTSMEYILYNIAVIESDIYSDTLP